MAGVTEKINQIFNDWPDLNKRFDEEFIQPSKIRQLEKNNEDRNTTGSGQYLLTLRCRVRVMQLFFITGSQTQT